MVVFLIQLDSQNNYQRKGHFNLETKVTYKNFVNLLIAKNSTNFSTTNAEVFLCRNKMAQEVASRINFILSLPNVRDCSPLLLYSKVLIALTPENTKYTVF